MKKSILLFIGLIVISGFQLRAQEGSIYNLYNFEPIMLNPAAAGLSDNPIAFFDYRKQWAGIEGAPLIVSGAAHGKFTNNMGAGLTFSQNTTGVFSTVSVALNYAYVVKISEDMAFIPGIFIGVRQNALNKDGLTINELADPIIMEDKYDKVFLTSGFGGRYIFKDLTVDFAIPNLYSGEDKKIAQSMLGYVAYNFYTANETWRIQPSSLYRWEADGTSYFDVNFMVEYSKILWTQLGYRTNKDVNIMAGINYKGFGFAYNYSITNSGMETISKGSHEVALRYTIPFSFIK